MNKAFETGNLVRDPELRTTQSGLAVCSFTIAVNRKKNAQTGQPEADYFRVTAWRQLGEICSKFLAKGRKVTVIGPVTVSTYTTQDGQTKAQMEITADDVEFLTPANQTQQTAQEKTDKKSGFVQVEDEIPF